MRRGNPTLYTWLPNLPLEKRSSDSTAQRTVSNQQMNMEHPPTLRGDGRLAGMLSILLGTKRAARRRRGDAGPAYAERKQVFERRLEPRGFEPLTPTMPLWCSTN